MLEIYLVHIRQLVHVSFMKQFIIHFLPSDSRFGDCHVLAFFSSAVLSWYLLSSDTWPGQQQTRHWLVHWQVTTQVPGGTSLHWSQVVTGDHSWHRRATRVPQVQCWHCLMQTSPKWHVPEREVSWYHLIILSFVPIIEFKRYISTIQCRVWSYQDSVTCYSWDYDILGTTAAVIPAGDKSCLITS